MRINQSLPEETAIPAIPPSLSSALEATMADEKFLCDSPQLRSFVLSNVQLTGTNVGGGAYGKVDEVALSVRAAAKIYSVLPRDLLDQSKAKSEFVRECQLMNTLRHPNIVQFLGVTFFSGSRLPALVMERLLMSLHDLLAPDTPPPRDAVSPIAFFSMALKCSVLQDVARGLAYLHEQSPPIIHRDLTARNILLNSRMVAKIAMVGAPGIMPVSRAAVTIPGALMYMPPEASEESLKYNASIDIFSLGVVTIFTVGETFPCDLLPNKESGLLVARSELERRSKYMKLVRDKLNICSQLRVERLRLLSLIEQCLQNQPAKRPSVYEIQVVLEKVKSCFRETENTSNLVQALQVQPSNQVSLCGELYLFHL